jgi:hypothetical protein
MKKLINVLLFALTLSLPNSVLAQRAQRGDSIPDFTQGDTIPEESKKDWNLGPTGMRGWMYCDRLVTKGRSM